MNKRLLSHFVLCVAGTVFLAACRDAHPQTTESGLQSRTADSFEDSGRRLTGDFVVQSLADDYAMKAVQEGLPSAFSFNEDGAFRSERKSGGVLRGEAGSYMISAQDEIVLYVETEGGEKRSGARIERYTIEAQSESELRLRRDGSA